MLILSRASYGQIACMKKVQRLSRKGVGDKRSRNTLTQEWVNDIVCAQRKLGSGLPFRVETCLILAKSGEQNHGYITNLRRSSNILF